jgi:hypothetical protein
MVALMAAPWDVLTVVLKAIPLAVLMAVWTAALKVALMAVP